MNTNEKAERGVLQTNPNGFNQNLNFTGGKIKGLNAFNYRQNSIFNQCQKCGSDYMKYSENGFCQDCQQRAEFVVREHPHIVRRVQSQASTQGATI